ncbi:Diacylglycerol O-acyltransferase 2 [Acipenser ruthenus]|uniref:Acyltransferase n=1 Tax=Acipenser ruthenus TaxID=7906 RepID=A0A444UZ19_ACIRT|nr:Diacylglycerol O-acyltransferase 2 [Acipenser ruthenus]
MGRAMCDPGKNPTWRSVDFAELPDQLDMSVSCFVVRIWGGRLEQYQLLIEWKVNLDGLRYTGQQIRSRNPNEIIFGLNDGYYGASFYHKDQSERKSSLLQVDQSCVRNTYSVFSLLSGSPKTRKENELHTRPGCSCFCRRCPSLQHRGSGAFQQGPARRPPVSASICPVNRNSMDYLLSHNGTGNAVVIVVGGAAESLECVPGKHSVTLKNRKGFVKLALQQGADLVPVYSFGENEVYKQIIFEEGSWGRYLQRKFQKLMGFAPCFFHGCGIFSTNSWGMVPYSKDINTVVGEPITVPKIESPSQDEVDLYHDMYVQSLLKLFDRYKVKFGLLETDTLALH